MTNNPQLKMKYMLDRLTDDEKEAGIQVAVYYHGELIVDACSGVLDKQSRREVDGNTLFPVFSAFKGVIATLIHILAEKGILDYNQKISAVWPAFGANGKKNITLRDLLTHSAGIPQMPEGLAIEDLKDWDLMCEKIAALKPRWPAGAHCEYHPMTFTWAAGEFLRRVSGREIMDLVRKEIGEPLDADDIYCGLPDALEPRVARLYESDSGRAVIPANPYAIPEFTYPISGWMNRRDMLHACIPATSAVMNAKSLARMYAALLPEGVGGVRLLSEERLKTALEPFRAKDGAKPAYGLGYAIFGMSMRAGAPTDVQVFGHNGYGGTSAFADRTNCLAAAITKNTLTSRELWPMVYYKLKTLLGI
ncbi:MAG: beta-lactamase family protein [Clostridiales bacterium]|jgi:CubicO group peptidase (beta-lactamase class C family)|nr:beta-lactamase family protein [Clostridiales bacterium]